MTTKTATKSPGRAAVAAAPRMIPLDKLVLSDENVRKSGGETAIKELAANIAANGLLQNLTVAKAPRGKFAVTGGGRRLRALQVLAKAWTIDPKCLVPCVVSDGNATDISLSENTQRLAMHPADQFEAWAKLADEGLSVQEIAKRHGCSVKLVEQRLKLGRLSPALLAALRADKLDLEAAAAFTLSDDHKRQEAVFKALSNTNSLRAYAIKRVLMEGGLAASESLAAFVGLEAYEAAGGRVTRDLFSEEVFLEDRDLVLRLATERLEEAAAALKAEGWRWTIVAIDYDYDSAKKMRRTYPKQVKLSAEDKVEQKRLEKRVQQLEAKGDEIDDAEEAEWHEIEEKLAEIDERAWSFSAKEKALAGCFVGIGYDGRLRVEAGFVRPEDDPEVAKAKREKVKARAEAGAGDYRRKVMDDLAAYRRQIVQAALMRRPDVAFDLLVFHLARDVVLTRYVGSPLEIEAKLPWSRCESSRQDMGETRAADCIKESRSGLALDWIELDEAEAFARFLSLSRVEKEAILAYVTALTLRPQLVDEQGSDPTLETAGALMAVDCARYWRPDTVFFERLTKAQALEIAGAVIGENFAQRHQKTKAKDLAPIMGRLFDPDSADHQKLTEVQRAGITAWQPACMAFAPLEVPPPSKG